MSNQDVCESDDDSTPRPLPRSAGGWNSFLGTVVLALSGIVLFWTYSEPAEVPENVPLVFSRTVIRWRQTPVFSLAWSPDNRRLAASCFGPVVRVWDREAGTVSSHEGGTEQPRFAVGWSEDSRKLMVSGLDMPIESWDFLGDDAGKMAGVVRPLDRSASSMALIQTSGARPIRLWGTGDKRFSLLAKSGQSANSIAFSADGRFLASGGIEGRLQIDDLSSGKIHWSIQVDHRGITAVSFSPDGSMVASSGPGPVHLWDVDSGREILRLGDERSGSATLGFSPDNSRIAVAGWDGSILVWDLTTGAPAFKLRGHLGQILSLAWSPDGKTLASGGYDSTVRIWDLAAPALKTASR